MRYRRVVLATALAIAAMFASLPAQQAPPVSPSLFAQLTWRRVTIGGYWFNPGSSDQVFVGLIGATF